MRLPVLILFICSLFFASCEKAEEPLVLPPTGSAQHGMVEMGPNYEKQIFYDFETGKEVFNSDPKSWHLSFQSAADGMYVYVNGAIDVYTYNTHQTDMDQVVELPASLKTNGSGWEYDAPSGNPDSTSIGKWFDATGATKGEVYIVQLEPYRYIKLRIVFADSKTYRIEWLPLESTGVPTEKAELLKNADYNYIYFSFDKGAMKPEPPNDTWDVVFTRYRYVYHTKEYPNFPYTVSGVLLNPNLTQCGADSVHSFDQIDLQLAAGSSMSTRRDVIGFDWKSYIGGRYVVNRGKNYILQTRNGQLFKLHFLDYYNASDDKGSPSFEYERLK